MPRRLSRLPAVALRDGVRLLVAHGRRSRLLGLAGLRAPPAGAALLLPGCRSVHTLGMRFALDLLWLGGDGTLVRLDRAVAPRRLRSCLRARAVVEVAAGAGPRFAAALAAVEAS
jgi:uncharacterized membrane protein (UPF0127 family)